MTVPIRAGRSGRRLGVAEMADFTGGLNLNDDRFKLAPNESPDLMNVDVDRRGGFSTRGAVAPLNTSPITGSVHGLWAFYDEPGSVAQVVAQGDDGLRTSTGGNFSWMTGSPTVYATNLKVSPATFGSRFYIPFYDQAVTYRWDGANATALSDPVSAGWDEDLATPSGTKAPRAKFAAAHLDYLWVAGTYESATAHPNRVRFSHPGDGGSWRSSDYIDVAIGEDGDVITALVASNDHLLVFKNRSVHAIFGYSVDTFQVVTISEDVGCSGPRSVVATPLGVFFWSARDGVYQWDGKALRWMFEPIYPALRDGSIDRSAPEDVALGWVDQRLWVSVPWQGVDPADRTFVFDPFAGQRGAWTAYDLSLSSFATFETGTTKLELAGQASGSHVLKLGQSSAIDDFGSGNTQGITAYYVTPWVAPGSPIQKKRWKRPEVVVRSGFGATLTVALFADYDSASPLKTFTLSTQTDSSLAIWGTAVWGTDVWSRAGSGGTHDEILRGSSLARTARAVALKIAGEQGKQWGVNAIALKYVPKPIRS